MIHEARSLARNSAALAMSTGSPEAAERDHLPHARLVRLPQGARHVGLHESRCQRVDPCRGRQLHGQRAGEVDQGRFGGVVDADRRLHGHPAHRGDVDDRAPRPFAHRALPRELGPHERTAQVHLPRLVVAREVDLHRGTHVRVRGGVVHEDVDATEALDAPIDRRGRLVWVAGVGGDHVDVAADLRRGGLEVGQLPRGEQHRRAGIGVGLRDRPADPP